MSGMAVIEFQMRVPIEISQDDNWYLASCRILDVHSQGETKEEAKKNVIEALQLFVISCYERGTLETVLKDCGFEPARDIGIEDDDDMTISVPLPLVARYAENHAY